MEKNELIQATLEEFKKLVSPEGFRKAGFTTAEGLRAVDLQAPSKKIRPVLSPLLNQISRPISTIASNQSEWKKITAVNTSKLKASVAEGTRNTPINYTVTSASAPYKVLQIEGLTSFEATYQGRSFEDLRATNVVETIYEIKRQQEIYLLGGNITAISAPAAPTVTVGTTGGTIATGSFNIKISALTLWGHINGATGRSGSTNSKDETLPGSATAASTTTTTSKFTITWTDVRGAVAYNVYISGTGLTDFRYTATVTVNKAVVTALPADSANIPNTAGLTAEATAYDGIIPQIQLSGAGSYYATLDGGTLTSDNAGGITEFDTMLQSLWDNQRLGPSMILVNSAQALSITQKIAGSSSLQYRVNLTDGNTNVTGGLYVGGYLNKFANPMTAGAPNVIPIMIHPFVPPGTIMAVTEILPYPQNGITNVYDLAVLQDYRMVEFAMTTREYPFGVETSEVLRIYHAGAFGTIKNVA